MSNLEHHAQVELAAAGVSGSDVDDWMHASVMELITVFARQGHSGATAGICIDLFTRLAAYKPLVPLTGADDEWNHVGTDVWQNRRCSRVFKDSAGKAWDIEGIVFQEPEGTAYTSCESHVPVEFPYVPHTQYVAASGPSGA